MGPALVNIDYPSIHIKEQLIVEECVFIHKKNYLEKKLPIYLYYCIVILYYPIIQTRKLPRPYKELKNTFVTRWIIVFNERGNVLSSYNARFLVPLEEFIFPF